MSRSLQTLNKNSIRFVPRKVVCQRGLAVAVEQSSSGFEPPPPMQSGRKPRKEGDIGSVFASLSGETESALPERFRDLKRFIAGDAKNQERLKRSWSNLTGRLAQLAPQIEKQQQACIPTTTYEEFVNSPSTSLVDNIKRCGTVIVRQTVSEDEATGWLKNIQAYIGANPSVKGFPADDKQVFELYWSKPQLKARSHPRSLAVQKSLLKLFSSSPSAPVSLDTPLTYCDRLRIRHPGDAKFALGPHMDGGSVERWEDPNYREVYGYILKGNWEGFNAWDMEYRAQANQNMYDGAGACGVFRAFQGWTSLSHTGPNEGTLRVYPYLREQTAYTLLRPFFRELQSRSSISYEDYLSSDNWTLDLDSSRFPGAPPARGQELNDETHPHLQLNRTMVSIPKVAPGDQAWWHCDTIHAVESVHSGSGPSAVLYIPSVPLTSINVQYVKDQRESFLQAIPPPDFPGGVGESQFTGTGNQKDLVDPEARNGMGLSAFKVKEGMSEGEKEVLKRANAILGL